MLSKKEKLKVIEKLEDLRLCRKDTEKIYDVIEWIKDLNY